MPRAPELGDGHIPMTVRPEEAADAGQFIEHEETLFEGTFPESLTAAQLPEAIHGFLADGAADSLFARLVRDHTPVTSTLTAWLYLAAHPDTSWLSDPRMRYVARSQKDAARRAAPMSADELVALVDAGLTPLQALGAATLTPSKVFNKEADFGSVTVGKRADLVLLDADPLADIRNTERIAAVVLEGKLFRRRDLDALLRAAEETAGKH